MTDKFPFSQACENNKAPILEILQRYLVNKETVLEIGGGTGQHAVFFAEQFPELNWQTSEVPEEVESLNLRVFDANLPNLPRAIPLDVNKSVWKCEEVEAIFSANCLHIMSADSVQSFFAGIGRNLLPAGLLLIYGPFKYHGKFTTESNAQFDRWLKNRNPLSGVRDFEWVCELAEAQNLEFIEDNTMPANNQLLVWRNQV